MQQSFPSAADYISAIEQPQRFVLDREVKRGSPRRGKDGYPLLYSGGYARVFVIDVPGKTYAFRCWVNNIGDAARHYRTVEEFLRQFRTPYLVDFAFESEGIFVNGKPYPTLRMEWIEAPSLRDFIGKYRNDSKVLTAAAENFLTMVQALHTRGVSHGDLQNDNLKVCTNGIGPDFRLIDYDTLFVPKLAGTKVTNSGVPGFQHPTREQVVTATAKDDYFAELVIYLALHALAEKPQLWEEERMELREKELIFAGEDFRSLVPTVRFKRLRKRSSPLVDKLTLMLWNYTRCGDIRRLIPLEEAAKLCRGPDEEISAPGSGEWLKEWSEVGAQSKGGVSSSSQTPGRTSFDDWLNNRSPRPKPVTVRPPLSPPPLAPTTSQRFDDWLRTHVPAPTTTSVPSTVSEPKPSDKSGLRWLGVILLILLVIIIVSYCSQT